MPLRGAVHTIMVSCLVFDLTAGLLAVALGALAFDFFLLPPAGSLAIIPLSGGFDLLNYVMVCGAIAIAIERFMRVPATDGAVDLDSVERWRGRPPF